MSGKWPVAEPPLLSVDRLGELEQIWRDQRLPLLDRLRPGLSATQVDAMTVSQGLRLPVEAKTLWCWHDGTDNDGAEQRYLGPGRVFMRLDEALDLAAERRAIAREVEGDYDDKDSPPAPASRLWNPAWFPVLAESWVAVIDCSRDPHAPAPVWALDWAADYRKQVARSMGEMVSFWIEAFQTGAWRFHPSTGRWEYRPDTSPPERYPLA